MRARAGALGGRGASGCAPAGGEKAPPPPRPGPSPHPAPAAPTHPQVHVLVLDECDQLLQMGFKPQLDQILAKLRPSRGPGARQSALVSATMPK